MTPSSLPARLPEKARILVVKFNAIGDVIMTTPALRDLRESYPSAHIAILVGAWSVPAIRKSAFVDEVIEFDQQMFVERRWLQILRLLLKVRRGRFDCAVIFHALPSIHLFLWLTGIPLRFGLRRAARARFLTQSVPENLDAGRYYAENYQEVTALAGARTGAPRSEVHADAEDEAAARIALAEAGLNPGDEFILVAPGGARNPLEDFSARRWPPEKFTELILGLLKDRPDLRIVLSGTPADREETGYIAARVPRTVDLTGKISLPQLFCVARASRAVVCNDSSALHIGVACGVPVVAPFGPTRAAQRLPDWARPYAWQSETACALCSADAKIRAEARGVGVGFECLHETSPADLQPLLHLALSRPHS